MTTRYQAGDKIGGRYLVHQAFMGGMGEVYLCLDLETIEPYALKTFQARYLTNQKLREVFNREVATWVALEKHPNIVRCFYMDIIDNQPFMLLEWIASDESLGTDLRSWLRRGPLDLRLALDFAIDICRGLIHAGQKQPGIVHRDLKPENILVAQGRIAKITDWGLAKIVQEADLEITDEESGLGERQSLLGGDGIVGTPPYMAPEQWRGEELDARTDIYALGCILYEMLMRRRPFEATTLVGLRRQHLEAAIPALPDGDTLSAALDTLLVRCLAKRREERFATVYDLLQELSLIYQQQFSETPRPIAVSGEFTALDLNNRGLTYGRLQRYDEALADLNRAIQLDPAFAPAYSNRGNTYYSLQRYDEALADLNHAIRLDPTAARPYTNRGLVYDGLQRYEKALADHTRAIQLDPAFVVAYYNRGNTYYSLQRYDEALMDYTRAIELDLTLVPAYNNRGNTYAKLLHHDEAIADYTRAIHLDPTFALAYTCRGNTYAELQRYDEALADFSHAIQLNPTDAQAYLNIGAILGNRDSLREALPYFEKVAQLGDPQGAQHAALATQMLNKSSS